MKTRTKYYQIAILKEKEDSEELEPVWECGYHVPVECNNPEHKQNLENIAFEIREKSFKILEKYELICQVNNSETNWFGYLVEPKESWKNE